MEGDSQFLYCLNLSAITNDKRKIANYIYAITGLIGLIVSLLLLTLLILYKAFKTVLQRLFLYFTLAVIASEVIQVLNVEVQLDINRDFCSWLGFLGLWSSISNNLLAIGLVLYIVAMTIQKARSRPNGICLKKKVSAIFVVLLEVLYLIATVSIPGAGLSILLKEHEYGMSETMCWLKKFDDDCVPMNHTSYYRYLNLTVPILQAFLMLAFFVLMVRFHLTVLKYQQSRKTKWSNLCRSLFLFSVVVLSLIAKLCEASVSFGLKNIAGVQVNDFYYDLFDELVQTILKNLLACGFAVYLYSPKKLKCSSIKAASQDWSDCCPLFGCCCCRKGVCSLVRRKRNRRSAEDAVDEEVSNTYESSVNYNTPSHTTYSTPYTNEFTDMTEILSFAQESCRPLKYGSVNDT